MTQDIELIECLVPYIMSHVLELIFTVSFLFVKIAMSLARLQSAFFLNNDEHDSIVNTFISNTDL